MTRKPATEKPYLSEAVEGKPGVFRIRRKERWEAGTVEAERIYSSPCSFCRKAIGSEPYVKVNGIPKHHSHLSGS